MSREFSEELGGCLVVEASQAGAIVVGNEGVEVGVAFGMVEKAAVMSGAVLRHSAEMLAKAAVEAFDHTVGLRPEGLGEAVDDGALGADAVEGMVARGFVLGFSLFVDGEAVGELGAVVGQDGVDLERKTVEEAREETGRGGGPAIGENFETDKAGGTVDRDIGVAAPAIEWRQVFDIDVDEAGRGIGVESDGRRRLRGEAGRQAVPLQAAVNAAARQFGVEAAPHHFDDVVERQGETAAQLDDQAFFPFTDRGGQAMRAGRTVGDILTDLPACHGAGMDAELAGQRGMGGAAVLDIGTGARGGGGIGVQPELHQRALPSFGVRCDRLTKTLAPVGPQGPPARRAAGLVAVATRARGSFLWTTGTSCAGARASRFRNQQTACHNRTLSRQSSETKHLSRGLRHTIYRSGPMVIEWFGDAQRAAHQLGAVAIGQPVCNAERLDPLFVGQQFDRACPVGAPHAAVEAKGVEDVAERVPAFARENRYPSANP